MRSTSVPFRDPKQNLQQVKSIEETERRGVALTDILPTLESDVSPDTASVTKKKPRSEPSRFEVLPVTSLAAAQDLSKEWALLHERSGSTNPFTHPAWLLTWAGHFVKEADLFIVTVRCDGVLVGVAPFYWVQFGPRRFGIRALHLLGNGRSSQFTEMPGILTDLDIHRSVFSALIGYLETDAPRWHWAKFTIDPQQGWFEPQWLSPTTKSKSVFPVQHAARASVVLELPECWDQFLSQRKRNVRESIRRSKNRLTKRIGDWSVDLISDDTEILPTLQRIIDLHEARSHLSGKPNHPSMFQTSGAKNFYLDAIQAMARHGQSDIYVLRCHGEIVAGLVTLRSGNRVFSSMTGSDPNMWEYGTGTIMIAELARREIALGTRAINLSPGPNQSKLRWSEKLEFDHDFALVGPTRGCRARFNLFSQASAAATVRRAKQWDVRDDAN